LFGDVVGLFFQLCLFALRFLGCRFDCHLLPHTNCRIISTTVAAMSHRSEMPRFSHVIFEGNMSLLLGVAATRNLPAGAGGVGGGD